MADYTTLGSFNTGGAASLNGELIQKLYDAESKSRVTPIETSLELWDKEQAKITEINGKVNELLEAVKPFDLWTAGNNAFEQVTATTSGDAAIFDAADVGALKPGTMNISISQIAQKDAYQSKLFNDRDVDITATADQKITINGQDFGISNVTLDELAATITNSGLMTASVEQVSDSQFRLVIKSNEPGTDNQLSITETDMTHLGLTDPTDTDGDGTTDNHILKAQNMQATVDGVYYDVSSNSITVDDNLKITASKIGDSTISIQQDDSSIVPAIQDMATKYNELLALVTEELYSADISVQDTSSLKSLLSDMKNMMYQKFGAETPIFGSEVDSDGDQVLDHSNVTNNETSLFSLGFSFDKTGLLTIDTSVLGKAVSDDLESIKRVFIGSAENEGFGTLLKEHIDSLNSFNGLFSTYENSMNTRKTDLEEEKEKAVKNLDTKYDTMAAQFSAYATVISQMESSFGALKQTIAAQNSSN